MHQRIWFHERNYTWISRWKGESKLIALGLVSSKIFLWSSNYLWSPFYGAIWEHIPKLEMSRGESYMGPFSKTSWCLSTIKYGPIFKWYHMSIFQNVTFFQLFSFVWAQFYLGWPQVFGLIQHFNFQKSNRLSNQLSIQLLKKWKKFWIRHNLWLRNQYFKNYKSCFKLFYSPLLPIFIGLFFCYVKKSYIYIFLHCIFRCLYQNAIPLYIKDLNIQIRFLKVSTKK